MSDHPSHFGRPFRRLANPPVSRHWLCNITRFFRDGSTASTMERVPSHASNLESMHRRGPSFSSEGVLSMTQPIRVSVTGAAGRIGHALLCRIAAGAMFGPGQPVALSLLDVPGMMSLLDSTMMELDDGAFPLLRSVRTSTDAVEAFTAADWILLLGSAPFQEGRTRSDALLANGPIFQAHGRAITAVFLGVASSEGKRGLAPGLHGPVDVRISLGWPGACPLFPCASRGQTALTSRPRPPESSSWRTPATPTVCSRVPWRMTCRPNIGSR
jgi:hypothetical protein